MTTRKSLLRIAALFVLAATACIGIFSTPDASSTKWFIRLVLSKIIGVASVYAFCRLYMFWRKHDKWISAYDKWIMK